MYNVEENFVRYMKDIGSNILFSAVPGETIKEVRKGIEASQEDMARLLGLRRETFSRIETGVINPTTTFIRRFSKMASIIKVFRDMNAIRDASPQDAQIPFNPTFIRTHFSLS
ncbi:MAG: helix-turn-helix transcriptional regulator, partial [Candidatus Hydrothermarchaeales archaeon]